MTETNDGDAGGQREGTSSAVVEHLRNAIRQAIKDPETMEVVELLCDNSGWTMEEFLQSPQEFRNMEVFLISTPRLPQLRLFPYLTVVKIIHVGLENMEALSHLHYVEELWLSENNIRVIEGIQNMTRLKSLYLQGNLIESMDNIPHLPKLQKLWLSNNHLQHISALNFLPKLKSLWVASNRISRVDNVFTSNMTYIEELNMSNNKIDFLGQLTHLCVLKSLRSLWLGDPMYGDAPICHLSNYTTFTLRHLPQLEQLDGVAITAEQRSLAVSVYAKKSVYYSMRRAILDRNIAVLLRRVCDEAEKKRNMAREALRQIDLELLELSECRGEDAPCSSVFSEEGKSHVAKLRQARETREVEVEALERQLLDAHQRMVFESDALHQRLLLELNSCGNIRLEEGTDADSWCVNAKELLLSRFDAKQYEKMGITGVKANRVFRIMCQGLRERFDNRIRELDIDLADARNRRALVRLFSAVSKHTQDQRGFLYEVMTNGFSGLYTEDDGVPLTNSLYYADQERLIAVGVHRDMPGVTMSTEALSGQLVVSRLFLGKCVAEMGGARDDDAAGETLAMKRERRKCTRRHYGDEVFSIYRAASYDASVKVWHMFDKSLLLPEYVIDFTYTTKAYMTTSPALSIYDDLTALDLLLTEMVPGYAHDNMHDARTAGYPLLAFFKWLSSNCFHAFANEETENVVRRAREFRCTKLNLVSLNGTSNHKLNDTSGKRLPDFTDTSISRCNMSNQKLTSIPEAFTSSKWMSLTTLFLHNNKVSSIAWSSLATVAPSLETLDLGNNVLEHLDLAGAQFSSLRTLCLSFNHFHVLEELQQLRGATPVLETLDMHHNPWMACKSAEMFCFAVVPQLKRLNGISVSRQVRFLLLQKRSFNLDQPTLRYILLEEQKRHEKASFLPTLGSGDSDHGSNIDVGRVYFFERVFAELAEKTESERALLLSSNKGSACSSLRNVRSFCFRMSLLRDIEWVVWLPQLRHLSLSSHLIEDISPLAELRHLRTLNLGDNVIKSAKPLSKLRLVSLDLSRNRLTSTEGLEELTELRYLSIGQNAITDVSELQHCSSLEELYFAQNLVEELRELHPLHRLPKLLSMDVMGNPCTGSDKSETRRLEYRNYVIYNLPKLKVLDGVPIGESDQQQARDLFQGRVNSELLVERVGAANQWGNVREVDLSQCGLREVTMLEPFVHLEVLHLHHNILTQISGLVSLQNLVALNLSHNRLGSFPVGQSLQQLENLRSLSLESNHITDVTVLGLELPRLKFLNLKGNEITAIGQGLHGLTELRELLLGNNKLRSFGHDCFANNLQLTDISAEENYIRFTEGLQPLVRLEVLDLGSNRLADLRMFLSDLRNACSLANVTLTGNAVARKAPYRPQMIAALPSLTMLDQKEVTDEEREKAGLMRAAEFATPHNVVFDPSFPVDAVGGGVRLGGAAVPSRPPHQPPRFPVTANPRVPLPAFKNTRIAPQARDDVSRDVSSRVNGGR